MNQFKYDYGRKVKTNKYLDEMIILPIQYNRDSPIIDPNKKYSEDGYIPDWDYMEKYIKSLPYGDRIN